VTHKKVEVDYQDRSKKFRGETTSGQGPDLYDSGKHEASKADTKNTANTQGRDAQRKVNKRDEPPT